MYVPSKPPPIRRRNLHRLVPNDPRPQGKVRIAEHLLGHHHQVRLALGDNLLGLNGLGDGAYGTRRQSRLSTNGLSKGNLLPGLDLVRGDKSKTASRGSKEVDAQSLELSG